MKLCRVISLISSVLLTLTLIAFAFGLAGYAYLNQQLQLMGVKHWQIEFEQLTPKTVVIDQLRLTLQAPEATKTTKASEKTPNLSIGDLLSLQLPSFVPQRIAINSLQITGDLLPHDILARVSLDTQSPTLQLQLSSAEPLAAELTLMRVNNQLQLQANHKGSQLNSIYDYTTGDLTADIEHRLDPLNLTEQVRLDETIISGQWQGQLSPEVTPANLQDLASSLSGELLLAPKHSAAVTVNDSSTLATGQLRVNLNNGMFNNYRLQLQGQTTKLDAFTAAELPFEIAELSWQLDSSDRLALPLVDMRQAVTKNRWPIRLVAKVTGKTEETIDVLSNFSVQQRQWQFTSVDLSRLQIDAKQLKLPFNPSPLTLDSLTSEFTGRLTTHTADLSSSEPVTVKLRALNTKASADLDFSRIYYPFANPQQVAANASGEFLIGQRVALQHQSQLTGSKLSSEITLEPFDWQQAPQLQALLKRLVPQLVISKASISAQTQLNYFLDSSRWQLDKGRLTVKQSDWVMDTLSVVNSNLAMNFSADQQQLDIEKAELHIASLQQGFVIGPVDAEFALQLPLQQPRNARLRLNDHSIKGLGGNISVPNQVYSLANDFKLPVVFENISLGELMRQYPSNKISVDGTVSGTLPINWNSNQLTVERGYLDALAPGGHLQVDSSALVSVAGDNPSLKTLAGVLSNFYYDQLSTVIDYDKAGNLLLAIKLRGSNPDVENGRPVELNVKLEEDLPALIKGLQLSNSLNDVIRKRVQQKIN